MSKVSLTDVQWTKIRAFLGTCSNFALASAEHCRNFLEAVFWMTCTRAQGRLLSAAYGKWNSIYKRFARRSQAGCLGGSF